LGPWRVTLPLGVVRFIFRLLYNELAFSYDLVAWLVSFGQWGAWRRTATLYLDDGPVLDLAHGTGGLMVDLEGLGHAPVGLDLSPHMGRIARRRLRDRGLPVRLVRGRAQQLPFPDGSYGNVVMTFPADFVLDSATLEAIARILQPAGRLVIVVMGHMRPVPVLRWLISRAYDLTTPEHLSEAGALHRLGQAGFIARWEDAELEGARARLLVATRNGG
jgi:ubiquinone/menaquinone biosynthesis C-methylase UbiE